MCKRTIDNVHGQYTVHLGYIDTSIISSLSIYNPPSRKQIKEMKMNGSFKNLRAPVSPPLLFPSPPFPSFFLLLHPSQPPPPPPLLLLSLLTPHPPLHPSPCSPPPSILLLPPLFSPFFPPPPPPLPLPLPPPFHLTSSPSPPQYSPRPRLPPFPPRPPTSLSLLPSPLLPPRPPCLFPLRIKVDMMEQAVRSTV